jgi:hypothetical protein
MLQALSNKNEHGWILLNMFDSKYSALYATKLKEDLNFVTKHDTKIDEKQHLLISILVLVSFSFQLNMVYV